MKRKSFISILLVLTMVLSVFAGCGQKEAEIKKEEASTQTPAQSEIKTEEKKEEKKEEVNVDEPPAKITLACSGGLQTDPVPWYEMDMWKEIWKLANVEIEYKINSTQLKEILE